MQTSLNTGSLHKKAGDHQASPWVLSLSLPLSLFSTNMFSLLTFSNIIVFVKSSKYLFGYIILTFRNVFYIYIALVCSVLWRVNPTVCLFHIFQFFSFWTI